MNAAAGWEWVAGYHAALLAARPSGDDDAGSVPTSYLRRVAAEHAANLALRGARLAHLAPRGEAGHVALQPGVVDELERRRGRARGLYDLVQRATPTRR